MTAQPPLSIVVTGRNDGYGGDFTARFLRTLRFNHERLREAGVAHEIVLVEWAPPPDRPHLIELIAKALPEVAGSIRTYLVDGRYHTACSLNPKLKYLEFLAKNVGIRRSRGQFVLSTNADVYLGRGIVDGVRAGAFTAGTIHRALRIDVRLGTDESHVDWAMLEDERNHHPNRTLRPPLYAGGSGDFILADRQTFDALRGFNEIYRVARIGIDVTFLVKAYASGYPIADCGAPVYHTNHVGSFQLSKNVVEGQAAEASWGTRWPSRSVIYENPDSWGLAAAPERQTGAGILSLDFDWAAVPPLVDLRRIVLPPARGGQVGADAGELLSHEGEVG